MVNATFGSVIEEVLTTSSSITVPSGEAWKVSLYGDGRLTINGSRALLAEVGDPIEGVVLLEGDTLSTDFGYVYMVGTVCEGVDNTFVQTTVPDRTDFGSIVDTRSVVGIYCYSVIDVFVNGNFIYEANSLELTGVMIGPEVTVDTSSGSQPAFIRGFEV